MLQKQQNHSVKPFFSFLVLSKPFSQFRNLMQVAELGKVRIDGPDRHYFMLPDQLKLRRIIHATLTSHWGCTAGLESVACILGSVKDEEISSSCNGREGFLLVRGFQEVQHTLHHMTVCRFIITSCVTPQSSSFSSLVPTIKSYNTDFSVSIKLNTQYKYHL